MTISVCITTKNRSKQLKECITSISKGSHLPNEIIVINEGRSLSLSLFPQQIASRIKILELKESNLSKGRNRAIKEVDTDIVCFTDDDCIVDRNWLYEISKAFSKHPSIVAVFGGTKPYEANKHPSKASPCVFMGSKEEVITSPRFHGNSIGFGNNMSFKKSVFEKYGLFKSWLGAGSIGKSAEDAEYALRLLLSKKKILHLPGALIYHNRWLSKKEMEKQMLSYLTGEMACYGYYHFQNKKFANAIVLNNLKYSLQSIKALAKRYLYFRIDKKLLSETKNQLTLAVYQMWGLGIGLLFSTIDPIR